MSNEIYHHEDKSITVLIGYIAMFIFLSICISFSVGIGASVDYGISLLQIFILPIYTTFSFLGIPVSILFVAVYLACIVVFYFFFGRARKVAIYYENGVLRKHKSWGMFAKEDQYNVSDVDYISVTQRTVVGSSTGRVYSSSDIISLVMKGIDIKVIPFYNAKTLEVAQKLASEISKQTGIPIK